MEELSINSQWKSCVRHCAQHAKQGIVVETDCDISVYWTQCTSMFLNGLFLSSAVSDELDLRQRLENMKKYIGKTQPTFPVMLFMEVELLPFDLHKRSQEICSAAGFVHILKATCMQTTRLLPPVRPLPAVEVKFAASPQDVHQAMLLGVEVYKMDASIAQSMVEHHAFVTDYDKQLCCTVLINEKPVATATTLLLDECLYVAWVATCAEHRKCGYAEIALRASIERALETLPHTKYGIVLHATEMSRTLYERMGFKEISHLDMYVYKPSTSV